MADLTRRKPQANATRLDDVGLSVWRRHPRKYALSKIGYRNTSAGINFYSLGRESAIGKVIAKSIDAHLHFLADSEVNGYVNRIVQKIVRHSDDTIPVTVRIVNDAEVDAYTLPGGFIYINTGLIVAADDEASLACMLAHEIAHVGGRHGTRIFSRRLLLAPKPRLMKFVRDLEREADLLAIQYAYAAGYDPSGIVEFLDKVRTVHKEVPSGVGPLADHPTLEERIQRAQIEIATMLPKRTDYVLTTSEFDQIKARLFVLTRKSVGAKTAMQGGGSQ